MKDLLDGPLFPIVFNAFITDLEIAIGPAFAEDPNKMMGGASPAAVAAVQSPKILTQHRNSKGRAGGGHAGKSSCETPDFFRMGPLCAFLHPVPRGDKNPS